MSVAGKIFRFALAGLMLLWSGLNSYGLSVFVGQRLGVIEAASPQQLLPQLHTLELAVFAVSAWFFLAASVQVFRNRRSAVWLAVAGFGFFLLKSTVPYLIEGLGRELRPFELNGFMILATAEPVLIGLVFLATRKGGPPPQAAR